jgi:hypothetical protein
VREPGRAVRDEDPLRVEIEQRSQRRGEALGVEARAALVDALRGPQPQLAVGADERVAERQRAVRGQVKRLLLSPRGADRVGGHSGHAIAWAVTPAGSRAPGSIGRKPDELARRYGVETIDLSATDDVAAELRERTGGRGPDSVIDAVDMEAHGAPLGKLAQDLAGLLPDAVFAKLVERAGVDRLVVLHQAIAAVRRGGTISLSGVYGGQLDPMAPDGPVRQADLAADGSGQRQALDRRDPAAGDRYGRPARRGGSGDAPPAAREGPYAYESFQKKQDGAIKIVLTP